jgi:hypothetical protein
MRRFVLLGLLIAVALPAGAAGSAKRVDAGSGISVVLPTGWRLVDRSITECSDPAQLVLLMETGNGRFPPRPARFHLPRRLVGTLGGCCEIPYGPGVELIFRDHGRKFYAFVYVGRRSGERQRTLALLNSLRISASR